MAELVYRSVSPCRNCGGDRGFSEMTEETDEILGPEYQWEPCLECCCVECGEYQGGPGICTSCSTEGERVG
jgi:hypothetical protein